MEKLKAFLKTELTAPFFINFLRLKSKYKSLFQFRCDCRDYSKYISLDKIFEYEHNSKFLAVPKTRHLLLNEIEGDDFHLSPLQGKLVLNAFEEILNNNESKSLEIIENEFLKVSGENFSSVIREMMADIKKFLITKPVLPPENKNFVQHPVPKIYQNNSREEIIQEITSMAYESEMCRLALYVYRQMDIIDWLPFIRAAIERNSVSFKEFEKSDISDIYNLLVRMPDTSIYDGKRLAMPDEVWNFGRGDGMEKSLLLAGNIVERDKNEEVEIIADGSRVDLNYRRRVYNFTSSKGFKKRILIRGYEYSIQ
ncbi:MAG: hypothetical protein ACUVTX_07155 [Bacteroidales bacterium]